MRTLRHELRRASTYQELVGALIKLRNNAYFASTALKRLLELNRKQAIHQPEGLTAAITGLLRDYKAERSRLSSDIDERMILQMIISPFNQFDDFALHQPTLQSTSYVEQFGVLYRDVHSAGSAQLTAEQAAADEAMLAGDPGTTTRAFVMSAFKGAGALAVGRTRVLDRVFPLFHSPALWSTLIPSEMAGGDVARNAARATSLANIAGYIHAVLLIEPLMLAGLMQANFGRIQKWLGQLPSVYAPGTDYVKEYLQPYDVFGTMGEAEVVLEALNSGMTSTSGPKDAIALLEDVPFVSSWAKMVESATEQKMMTRRLPDVLTDLAILQGPEFTAAVASAPLGTMEGLTELKQLTALGDQHQSVLRAMATLVRDYITEFLPDTTIKAVKDIGRVLTFAWPNKTAVIGDASILAAQIANDSELQLTYGVATATSHTERTVMERYLLTFTTSSTILDTFRSSWGIDHYRAAKYAEAQLDKTWETLYPTGYLRAAGRVVTRAELGEPEALLNLLTSLTGRPMYSLKNDLELPTMQLQMATAMSSFLQLFVIKRVGEFKQSASGTRVAEVEGGAVTLIKPEGQPYGMNVDEWNSLFAQANGLAIELIPGVLAYRIIGSFALPSTELRSGTFADGMTYRYFVGAERKRAAGKATRGEAFDVMGLTRVGKNAPPAALLPGDITGATVTGFFTVAGTMKHYASFPVLGGNFRPKALFNVRFFYLNESIVGQLQPGDLETTTAPTTVPIAVKELAWNHVRSSIHAKAYGFGDETSAAGAAPLGAKSLNEKGKAALDKLADATRKANEHANQVPSSADAIAATAKAAANMASLMPSHGKGKGDAPEGRGEDDRKKGKGKDQGDAKE